MKPPTTTLYRPVGPQELALIEAGDWAGFPSRLPDQPIFYPVMNEEYAIQIARDWNVPASGSGFVTRFEVDSEYLQSSRRNAWARGCTGNCGFQRRNWRNLTGILSAALK